MARVVKGAEAGWGTCSRTVTLDSYTWALSYWNNTIAVGSENGDIIILDAITGNQMAVLSGYLEGVNCFTFSSDGKSLVSGSNNKTIKLWDMQTGGVAKTFHSHTGVIWSVSISADCTRIVSGSQDQTIHLWDTQTGECSCIIKQSGPVYHVNFSPINPQHITSISDYKVWQWDVNGHQIPPTYNGSYIAFSPDHTKFALCNWGVVTVYNSNSRVTVTEFSVPNDEIKHCYFSPDSRLVAAAAGRTAYVWDVINPGSHPIETFVGHTEDITSLVFSSPSSLISASEDSSVKFWKIGALSTHPVMTGPQSTLSTPPSILSVSLQKRAGIAISSDAEGMVKTWDISTGLCGVSFQTPAKYFWRDVQLMDGRLMIVWCQNREIHIWDVNNNELLQTIDLPPITLQGLRISGDMSKIFSLTEESIQAWSIHTGELVSEVKLGFELRCYLDPLQIDSSRIWIRLKDSSTKGWDFGISGSPPIQLFDMSARRPLLEFIGGTSWQTTDPLCWINHRSTGKEVFQLSGRYVKPCSIWWDGQYLVVGYESGEVLILDFHHMCPQ